MGLHTTLDPKSVFQIYPLGAQRGRTEMSSLEQRNNYWIDLIHNRLILGFLSSKLLDLSMESRGPHFRNTRRAGTFSAKTNPKITFSTCCVSLIINGTNLILDGINKLLTEFIVLLIPSSVH